MYISLLLRSILAVGIFFMSPSILEANWQAQGFISPRVSWGTLNGSCPWPQCYMVSEWSLDANEQILLSGSLQGSGQIFYWFLVNNQIISGGVLASESFTGKRAAILYDSPYFSRVPKSARIIIVFDGGWQIESLVPELGTLSTWAYMNNLWDRFWRFDTYKPYTINLLMGPEVRQWMYVFITIIGVILLVVSALTKNRMLVACSVVSVAWILFEIRMGTEIASYALSDITSIHTQGTAQQFRDQGNLHEFSRFAQNEVQNRLWKPTPLVTLDNGWPHYGMLIYGLYPYPLTYATGSIADVGAYILRPLAQPYIQGSSLRLIDGTLVSGEYVPFDSVSGIFFPRK